MRAALTILVLAACSLCPRGARAADEGAPPKSLAELVDRARALEGEKAWESLLPAAGEVFTHPEATVEHRLDATLMQACALAMVAEASEAEKPFRLLLRGRPGFEMPADTDPKILAVFRKVQADEKAILSQVRELTLRELKLAGEPPVKGEGGSPLTFGYRLRDPRGMVAQMNLRYRREGEKDFASLSLVRNESGGWAGAIPGEWTQSEKPYQVEYYLTTADAEGQTLVDLAAATAPLKVPVEPQVPLYKSGWFWGAVGVVAVAVGAAAGILVSQASALPSSDLGTIQPR
ncbi:MAG TPA: hypothetical protein VGK67_23475 [Myxococcales bacterium]